MSRKKWVVLRCDKDKAAEIAENCGIDPFTSFLLCARGLTDEFEIEDFLYDTDLCNPFLLPDMDKACDRINKALENGERITVFGDYDADGVTSTALLYSYLLGRDANVDYYIPDRAAEGYGMNFGAIDILKERKTSLIVTVDNGISAVEEIRYANELGIDTVVTDHHRTGEVLPDAVAVVDPHRDDAVCEFKEWAGVGVAFKLACALEGDDGYELLYKFADIVAIGTVADIVPLLGENRVLVKSGINLINELLCDGMLRKGVKALMDVAGLEGKPVTSADAAFKLSPRINAAGRMGSAERALKLLLATDYNEALDLAKEISEANSERQATEKEIAETAQKLIEENPEYKFSRVIVVDGEGWHQGVIGIVASRLAEKYGKPAIVISRNGEDAKGSGRSVDGFSLYNAFSACSDVLTQFGGHTLAAGMSLKSENIDLFRKKINEYAEKIDLSMPVLKLDCKLNPASINFDMLNSLEILEPFGAENPQPVFGLFNMKITSIQPIGGGKHLKITVSRGCTTLTVVMFSQTVNDFPFYSSDIVDLAVRISKNEYMGEEKISVQVRDIKLSALNDDEIQKSIKTYESFRRGDTIDSETRKKLLPDREIFSGIYKYIRKNAGWDFDADLLCYRLGLKENKIASCKIVLDVLSELGVLLEENGKYSLPQEQIKVELENSLIYKALL